MTEPNTPTVIERHYDVLNRPAWVRRAVKQRCTVDGDWNLPRRKRWAYTLKAVVLVLLGRERRFTWRDHYIEVAYANQRSWAGPEFTMYEWERLGVLHGWRPSSWFINVTDEGAP